MSDSHYYRACGVIFRSELALPGIQGAPAAPLPGEGAAARIRLGNVPEALDHPSHRGAAFEATPSELLLKTPAGRYWIRAGAEIVVDPKPAATDEDVRTFLLNSAFAALLHQRGLVPLHASAVLVGGSAVAFAGISGAGKSTLAAFLQRKRGYTFLADDLCAVQIIPGIGAVAFPGFPRLRLWGESLKGLGLPANDYPKPRGALEKHDLAMGGESSAPFFPLKRLYLLREIRDFARDPQGLRPVTGPERLRALIGNTYRFRFLKAFQQTAHHLKVCAATLQSIEVFQLWRPWGIDMIAPSLDKLEAHWSGLAAGAEQVNVRTAA